MVIDPVIAQAIVRQVGEGDLLYLEWDGQYRHYRKVYADAFTRSQTGRSVLWLAELPGAPAIGQVFIQLVCDRPELADGRTRAYLYAFRIKPEYRSRGLGSHMMQVVEEDLRLRGFGFVTLNVARTNTRARRLYERLGYRIVAPEPGIWSFPDEKGAWHTIEEPAWRMEKKLH